MIPGESRGPELQGRPCVFQRWAPAFAGVHKRPLPTPMLPMGRGARTRSINPIRTPDEICNVAVHLGQEGRVDIDHMDGGIIFVGDVRMQIGRSSGRERVWQYV